ncbi:MAG: SDR family oxidoreductase [Elusimicrobiota bacterium]|jgi:enoyl-[acyl-carrier protein] reductase I
MSRTHRLKGKTAVVFGVASEESIAWAIAQELAAQGAQILLAYQFRYHSRIKDLAPKLPNLLDYRRCDVQNDKELDSFFHALKTPVDILVHSIAYAPATSFQKPLSQTSSEDFTTALQVSAHSLAKILGRALPHMPDGGSVMTMSFLGGQRAVVNYNVMGVAKAALEAYVRGLALELGPRKIRVNALSPGPIQTLAASGIPEFEYMLSRTRELAPLRETATQEDVAKCAAFLASEDARMITGQTILIDGGYSIVGYL